MNLINSMVITQQEGDGENVNAAADNSNGEEFYSDGRTIGIKSHLNSISKEPDELWFLLLKAGNEKSQIHRGNRDGYVSIAVK